MKPNILSLVALLLGACTQTDRASQPPASGQTEVSGEDEARGIIGAKVFIVEPGPMADGATATMVDPEHAKLLAVIPECQVAGANCRLIANPILLTHAHAPAMVEVGSPVADGRLELELRGYPIDESVFVELEVAMRPALGERGQMRRLRYKGGIAAGKMTRLGSLSSPAGASKPLVYVAATHGSTSDVMTWLDPEA